MPPFYHTCHCESAEGGRGNLYYNPVTAPLIRHSVTSTESSGGVVAGKNEWRDRNCW
jgi:hypothetical protein